MKSLNELIITLRTVVVMVHFHFFNMLYFFVLGFFLLVNINEISGEVTSHTPKPNVELSEIPLDPSKVFNSTLNFRAEHPYFFEMVFVNREIREYYFVAKGIEPHKAHRRELAWNRAGRICMEEGGNYIETSSCIIH